MTDFGTIGFGTLEPGNGTAEEQICFTGVVQNSNGTATLTGVSNVLFLSPYTQTSGLSKTHAGSTTFIISNTSGFYDELTSKDDDEIITGLWTFPSGANNPVIGVSYVAPTTDLQIATKKYVDDVAIAGSPKATTVTYGISRLSTAAVDPLQPIVVGDNDTRIPTQGENDALVGNNTDIAVGTGNKYVTQTGFQHNAEKYAADAGSNDTYVITLSPVPTSYTNGMVVYFKANTVNTGAATINVNNLGAKTIVKGVNTTLANGDIAANMFCTLIYDGTNFVLQNPVGNFPASATVYSSGTTTKDSSDASTVQNIAHGLGKIPTWVRISALAQTPIDVTSFRGYTSATAVYNGTTQTSICIRQANTGITSDTTFKLNYSNNTGFNQGVVTFDATNIIITWTYTATATGTYNLIWEAEASS